MDGLCPVLPWSRIHLHFLQIHSSITWAHHVSLTICLFIIQAFPQPEFDNHHRIGRAQVGRPFVSIGEMRTDAALR